MHLWLMGMTPMVGVVYIYLVFIGYIPSQCSHIHFTSFLKLLFSVSPGLGWERLWE